MIIAALRSLYHAVVPVGIRRILHVNRFSASRRARARLWFQTGGRVAAGPFRDMRLAGDVPGECYGPDLLGSYECEVHEWLEREIVRDWPAVVNVGSNGGFYSTGLAMRLPNATVYAFDLDPALRTATLQSAERNGVEARVKCFGAADRAALAALRLTRALVVCDCEGYERELLDPALVPWLARSAMLVELHDFAAPGTTEVMTSRFAHTHDIVLVEQRAREARLWAQRVGITEREAAILAEELRPWRGANLAGRWMLLTPR